MKYLITGGCGFLGSNLSLEVIRRGESLCIMDNLFRTGSEKNLSWLQSKGEFTFFRGDIRNKADVDYIMQQFCPDIIFHVAGQVAMTTSINRPDLDFETNLIGSFNILEAIKKFSPNAIIIYSSTNKVYGDLENYQYIETETRYKIKNKEYGFNEEVPLDFRTPYGCSKGGADQYIHDAFRSYNIQSVVFRHSSIYGGRQFSTYDQGWIGWFVQQALEIKQNPNRTPFSISGNGKQVRDVLHADDLVSCYFNAIKNIHTTAGEVFNIGGGVQNSLSLLELFKILEAELSIEMNFKTLPVRASDQKVFIADISKAKKLFKWSPQVSREDGIRKMIKWVQEI